MRACATGSSHVVSVGPKCGETYVSSPPTKHHLPSHSWAASQGATRSTGMLRMTRKTRLLSLSNVIAKPVCAYVDDMLRHQSPDRGRFLGTRFLGAGFSRRKRRR